MFSGILSGSTVWSRAKWLNDNNIKKNGGGQHRPHGMLGEGSTLLGQGFPNIANTRVVSPNAVLQNLAKHSTFPSPSNKQYDNPAVFG